MTFDKLRLLGWLIPVICLGTSGWLIYSKNTELRSISDVRNKARIDVQQAIEQKRKIESMHSDARYATVDVTADEEYTFIAYLKTAAASCGVLITDLSSQTTDAGTDPGAKDGKPDPLLKGIEGRNTLITMRGSYTGLREMVWTLESSIRLLALSNLTWARTDHGTSVTVNVTRFVSPKKKSSS
ncbi:MAG: hypothetical protein P4L46_21385 [Fimbriimonas sp.]|nr:hypothetical protein [Fimbriimonas sp.]